MIENATVQMDSLPHATQISQDTWDRLQALSLPASPAPLPAWRLGARRARKNTTEDTENTEKSPSEFGPEASNQVDFDNVLHLPMLRLSLCTLWFNLRSLYVF